MLPVLTFNGRWYDDRVKNGDLADALIGTFSSLAHELAHNLVLPHNSCVRPSSIAALLDSLQ